MTPLSLSVLILLLLAVIAHCHAGLLPPNTAFLFMTTSCPPGSRHVAAANLGRVFVGAGNGLLPNVPNAAAAIVGSTEPTHAHGVNGALPASLACSTFAPVTAVSPTTVQCLNTFGLLAADGAACVAGGASNAVSAAPSGYPFLNVNMCITDGSVPFAVGATSAVFLLEPSTSQTCGADAVVYADAVGRVLVPLSSASSATSTAVGTAFQAGLATTHAHSFSASVIPPWASLQVDPTPLRTCSKTAVFALKPSASVTLTAAVPNGDLNIPMITTTVCKTSVGGVPVGATELPVGAMLYFASSSCPSGWVPAAAMHTGRFLVPNDDDFGIPYGSVNTLAGGGEGTGPDVHAHTVADGVSLTGTLAKAKLLNPGVTSAAVVFRVLTGNAPFSVTSGVGQGEVPYLALRLCERAVVVTNGPSASPTKRPSAWPTSSHPSVMPSTSTPTSSHPSVTPSTSTPTSSHPSTTPSST